MFDLSTELCAFHDTYVKLDYAAVEKLAEVRKTSLQRIRNGLADAGFTSFKAWRNQGGYAMKNRHC